jgi:hypothetical protein
MALSIHQKQIEISFELIGPGGGALHLRGHRYAAACILIGLDSGTGDGGGKKKTSNLPLSLFRATVTGLSRA